MGTWGDCPRAGLHALWPARSLGDSRGRGVPAQAPGPRDSGSSGGRQAPWVRPGVGTTPISRKAGTPTRHARQGGHGGAPLGPCSEESAEAVTLSPGLGSAGLGAGGQHSQGPALFRQGSPRGQDGTRGARLGTCRRDRGLDREPLTTLACQEHPETPVSVTLKLPPRLSC